LSLVWSYSSALATHMAKGVKENESGTHTFDPSQATLIARKRSLGHKFLCRRVRHPACSCIDAIWHQFKSSKASTLREALRYQIPVVRLMPSFRTDLLARLAAWRPGAFGACSRYCFAAHGMPSTVSGGPLVDKSHHKLKMICQ
jgi:hypothetical protein